MKLLARLQTEEAGSELANQVDEAYRDLIVALLGPPWSSVHE